MTNDALKLENQLCFPLYAAARKVVKAYTPYLSKIGLTYTQYIVMMVLWEQQALSVQELGNRLSLDSGTLSPLLKRLEEQGYCERRRLEADERVVEVMVTEKGTGLKKRASGIPEEMKKCMNLSQEEAMTLYGLLYKIM
ncbi:MAG: MarR family winged helix-turn-helix transcriptional regulator [Candidatus Saccharimonadales bacterium]